jgi:hypothetical protein
MYIYEIYMFPPDEVVACREPQLYHQSVNAAPLCIERKPHRMERRSKGMLIGKKEYCEEGRNTE